MPEYVSGEEVKVGDSVLVRSDRQSELNGEPGVVVELEKKKVPGTNSTWTIWVKHDTLNREIGWPPYELEFKSREKQHCRGKLRVIFKSIKF